MMTYDQYQDRFCRDLGLCVRDSQHWGDANQSPAHVQLLAAYYLNTQDLCRVGREMILECLLSSFDDALREGTSSAADSTLMRAIFERATADLYDRDAWRLYYKLGNIHDPYPLSDWIAREFPAWVPEKSVWAQME